MCNYNSQNGEPIHCAGPNCTSTFTVIYYPCGDNASGGTNTSNTETSSTNNTTNTSNSNTTNTSNNSSSGSSGSSGIGFAYGYDYTTSSNNNYTYTGVGQTYGTGGGLGNPIVINPVPPCPTCPELEEEEEEEDNPCEKLTNVTNNTIINNSIKSLKSNTTSIRESSIQFNKGPLDFLFATPTTNNTENHTSGTYYNTTFGTVHVHTDGLYPIPSIEDLVTLSYMCLNFQQPSDSNDVNFDDLPFNFIISNSHTSADLINSPHGNLYAIVPDNITSFGSLYNSTFYGASNLEKIKKMDNDLKNDYEWGDGNNWNTVNQDNLAIKYLQYINSKQNFGISLYRKKFDINNNPTGDWEKLSLGTQNGITILIKTPC